MRIPALSRIVLATALAGLLAACGAPTVPALDSIATIAAEDEQFSTLVAALTKADLVDTFADPAAGPFTVFAPTNAAFQQFLTDTGLSAEELLDSPDLVEILQLHVVEGEVSSADAIAAVSARSLGSELLYFIVDGDDLRVDDVALVTSADIEASNGVIHVIDAVLQPKGTIADAVVARANAAEPEFQTLLTAIQAANADVLATLGNVELGPFTAFGPTDEAFAAIDSTVLANLLADEAALTDVLLYHVTDAGALLASQVIGLAPTDVEMLNGDTAAVKVDGGVFVNDALVVGTDVLTANGVIHVIDSVLLPPADNN